MLILFLFQDLQYVPSPISLYIEDLKQKPFATYRGISKYMGDINRGLPVFTVGRLHRLRKYRIESLLPTLCHVLQAMVIAGRGYIIWNIFINYFR